MAWACLLEVEAKPGEMQEWANPQAFVTLYLAEIRTGVAQAVEEACAWAGVACREVCDVKEVPDDEVPEEAQPHFEERGTGFGTFHTFSADASE